MINVLTLVMSILALIVALVSVWFVNVMVKRAKSVHREFYEGNVRGTVKLLQDVTKSTEAALRTAEKLDKSKKKDLQLTLGPRLDVLEQTIGEIQSTIETLETQLPGSPKQML